MRQAQVTVPAWELQHRLRRALEHAGVTTTEIGEYLEVHRNTVNNWLHGRTRPRPAEVRLWAERCGVPYAWLAHGIEVGLPRLDSNQQPAGCGNETISTAELAGFLKQVNIPAAALAATQGRGRVAS